jgi:hypothetical protein
MATPSAPGTFNPAQQRVWADLATRLEGQSYPVGTTQQTIQSYLLSLEPQAGHAALQARFAQGGNLHSPADLYAEFERRSGLRAEGGERLLEQPKYKPDGTTAFPAAEAGAPSGPRAAPTAAPDTPTTPGRIEPPQAVKDKGDQEVAIWHVMVTALRQAGFNPTEATVALDYVRSLTPRAGRAALASLSPEQIMSRVMHNLQERKGPQFNEAGDPLQAPTPTPTAEEGPPSGQPRPVPRGGRPVRRAGGPGGGPGRRRTGAPGGQPRGRPSGRAQAGAPEGGNEEGSPSRGESGYTPMDREADPEDRLHQILSSDVPPHRRDEAVRQLHSALRDMDIDPASLSSMSPQDRREMFSDLGLNPDQARRMTSLMEGSPSSSRQASAQWTHAPGQSPNWQDNVFTPRG